MEDLSYHTMNVKGCLFDLSHPSVMGIINITPDSFFAGSRKQTDIEIATRANQIIEEGGSMLDVGAFSTRPGAAQVSEEEEMQRLRNALAIIRREQPEAIISIDTFRPDVAKMCVEEYGADIINDVSEGGITGVVNTPLEHDDAEYPAIFRMVAQLGVAYILMSVKPDTQSMMKAFAKEVQQLRDLGVKDIILDPGYGFGKTLDDNYRLIAEAERLNEMNLPVLVGISRKSMMFKLLNTTPDKVLNATTALHMMLLQKGASILRVHDVKEAVETVKLFNEINKYA